MKHFLNIYRNRFWRLTLINFAYFILVSPLMLIFYICVNAYTGIYVGDSSVADVLPGLGFFMSLFSMDTAIGRVLTVAAVVLSAILFGPLKMTVYHIETGYFTSSNFFFSDTLSELKKKLTQTIILGILDLLILGRTLTNLSGIFTFEWTPILTVLLRLFSLVVLLFWLTFRRWAYLLISTCQLRFFQILKRSFLLTVSGLGKSSKCSAFCVLIWAIVFLTIPIVTVITLPLFAFAASSLATVCTLYPLVQSTVFRGKTEIR